MEEYNYSNSYENPEIEEREYIKERAKCADDLRKVFWLSIISLIGSTLSNTEMLSLVGNIAVVVCGIMLLVIFLRMGKVVEEYKISAYCGIGAAVAGVVATFLTFVASVASIVAVYGTYKEYKAHGEILTGVDDELASKWENLWTWTILAVIALVVCVFLAAIAPVIGIIAVLIAAVGVLTLRVLYFVYLHKMVKIFEELERKCQRKSIEE